MGNIFSYYFKSNNIKYNDSLLDPLTKDMDEDIQYASLLDIQSINGQVGILEETTQSSLKNISTDVNYLFEEVNNLKKQIDYIFKKLDSFEANQEIYQEANQETYQEANQEDNQEDNQETYQEANQEDNQEDYFKPNKNNKELSVYLDANTNHNQD